MGDRRLGTHWLVGLGGGELGFRRAGDRRPGIRRLINRGLGWCGLGNRRRGNRRPSNFKLVNGTPCGRGFGRRRLGSRNMGVPSRGAPFLGDLGWDTRKRSVRHRPV